MDLDYVSSANLVASSDSTKRHQVAVELCPTPTAGTQSGPAAKPPARRRRTTPSDTAQSASRPSQWAARNHHHHHSSAGGRRRPFEFLLARRRGTLFLEPPAPPPLWPDRSDYARRAPIEFGTAEISAASRKQPVSARFSSQFNGPSPGQHRAHSSAGPH